MTKHFGGRVTELDVILPGCAAYEVTDAILTKERIAIEWTEGEDKFFALMTGSSGVEYAGHFGWAGTQQMWPMKCWRYAAADGRVLLLAEWDQGGSDNGGTCLFGLIPKEASQAPSSRSNH